MLKPKSSQMFNIDICLTFFFVIYSMARWLIPVMKQCPPDEKNVKRMQRGMEACLADIEKVWLSAGSGSGRI
jgi:hypothetical protein